MNTAGEKPFVLLIDNFDSFSFNLAEEFESRGCRVEVWRNDIAPDKALGIVSSRPEPKMIVISPGPGGPSSAGNCIDIVQAAKGRVPLFGICLGHQVIVEAYGGEVGRSPAAVHGKASRLFHEQKGVFAGLPQPFSVGRYHSLTALKVPDCLTIKAYADGQVMAVRHINHPVIGVQFHPESILTTEGGQLFENVIAWVNAFEGEHERDS